MHYLKICYNLESFKIYRRRENYLMNQPPVPIIQLQQFSIPGRSWVISIPSHPLAYFKINLRCHIISSVFSYVSLKKWVSLFQKHSYNIIITPKNKNPGYFLNILQYPDSFYEVGSKKEYTCHWLLCLLMSLFIKNKQTNNYI